MKNNIWFVGFLLIVSIIVMRTLDMPLINNVCTNGIVSFELAKELPLSISIIDSWNEDAKSSANKSLIFDFFFLLVYAYFIAILIEKTKGSFKKIFTYLIYSAAFFDIIENIALLNLLHRSINQISSSIAFYFASAKFVLIIICLIYLLINGVVFLLQRTKTNH